MLTGQRRFQAKAPADLRRAIETDQATLARDPAERYASASEFADALRSVPCSPINQRRNIGGLDTELMPEADLGIRVRDGQQIDVIGYRLSYNTDSLGGFSQDR